MTRATYHVPYEPSEHEIYHVLTREIQQRWTETERLSRGYDAGCGVSGPGIKTCAEPIRVDTITKE